MYATLMDPYDTSPTPELRTWPTLAEARAYSRAQLDLCPDLDAVAIGNGDGSDVVELCHR